jgi:hypothetical protein
MKKHYTNQKPITQILVLKIKSTTIRIITFLWDNIGNVIAIVGLLIAIDSYKEAVRGGEAQKKELENVTKSLTSLNEILALQLEQVKVQVDRETKRLNAKPKLFLKIQNVNLNLIVSQRGEIYVPPSKIARIPILQKSNIVVQLSNFGTAPLIAPQVKIESLTAGVLIGSANNGSHRKYLVSLNNIDLSPNVILEIPFDIDVLPELIEEAFFRISISSVSLEKPVISIFLIKIAK